MRTIAALLLAWFASAEADAQRPAAAGSGNYHRMKMVRVVDERGFERPMTALSLLIPTDWQFQGNAQYSLAPGCHGNLVRLVFRAASPDGRLAIEMLPGNSWQWADDPNSLQMMRAGNQQMAQFGARGCDIMPPMTAEDFLRRSIIPAARREARVERVEPIPDVAQQLQEQARQAEQAAARQGIPVRVRADVASARLSYGVNGQPVEEWLIATTFSSGIAGPSFNMNTGRMGQTLFYTCGGDHVFGLRAPQGQLDAQESFFRMVLSTVRVDPQWQARVTQVIANMQAAEIKGARDRSAIITKSGQDIGNIISQTYENTNRSRDHAMEGWSQYTRGVETYRNPNTGEMVDLSNRYGHAWAGASNEYIVTDSANFDPNVSLRGNWTRLEQVRR